MPILYPVLFSLSVLTACQQSATVSGTASFDKDVTLPHGAIFEAILEDVSIMDIAAGQLSKIHIDKIKQSPIRFTIPYDEKQIKKNHSYSVRGQISINGKLIFTTETMSSVLTRGYTSTVQLKLRAVQNFKSDSYR